MNTITPGASGSVLPADWLPDVPVAAIVAHWTAGNHECSDLDRSCYHFIIDGNGVVHRGTHSVADNIPPLVGDKYAAHTLHFNSSHGKAVVGISVCGMGDATQSPFKPGRWPISEAQVRLQARIVAQICQRYGVPVGATTTLQHGEVQQNLGITQRGKWDITKWPWAPNLTSAQVCAQFREWVQEELDILNGKVKTRLFLQIDGNPVRVVPNAELVDGSWQVAGPSLSPLLPGSHLSDNVLPLRVHLTQAGYKAGTVTKYLNDPHDPHQVVAISKAQ